MITIINKTNYVNTPTIDEMPKLGFINTTVTDYNKEKNKFENHNELIEDKYDYFPNTDWRDNELSMLIPAGIDPGQIRYLQNNPLTIGDTVQQAINIIENSDINDIVEQ